MEYDIDMIRTLCDRYFEGKTTPEEEQVLREYFAQAEQIPSDLQSVRTMFCGFAQTALTTYVPAAGTIRKGRIRRIVWSTVAAAACTAACIAVFRKEVYGYDADGKAITDPQTALEGTAYLAYLSDLETTLDVAHMLLEGMEDNN